MAFPIQREASSVERSHKSEEIFAFPWYKPCNSTHDGKERRLPCYYVLKKQCTLNGSGKRHCLWLIRLGSQQWGSPTPGAPCGTEISLVGLEMLTGMEAIPSTWLAVGSSTREFREGCSLKQNTSSPIYCLLVCLIPPLNTSPRPCPGEMYMMDQIGVCPEELFPTRDCSPSVM